MSVSTVIIGFVVIIAVSVILKYRRRSGLTRLSSLNLGAGDKKK